MKKTIIALTCVLVSSASMAASLSMGTTNSHTITNGDFAMNSGSLTTRQQNSVTVIKDDGSKLKSYAFDQVIKKSNNQEGVTSGNSLLTSNWYNAGGATWGTSSMTNGSSIDTIVIGDKSFSVMTEEREIDAFDANGNVLYYDTIDANTTTRTDNYTGTVTTTTSSSGIFLE